MVKKVTFTNFDLLGVTASRKENAVSALYKFRTDNNVVYLVHANYYKFDEKMADQFISYMYRPDMRPYSMLQFDSAKKAEIKNLMEVINDHRYIFSNMKPEKYDADFVFFKGNYKENGEPGQLTFSMPMDIYLKISMIHTVLLNRFPIIYPMTTSTTILRYTRSKPNGIDYLGAMEMKVRDDFPIISYNLKIEDTEGDKFILGITLRAPKDEEIRDPLSENIDLFKIYGISKGYYIHPTDTFVIAIPNISDGELVYRVCIYIKQEQLVCILEEDIKDSHIINAYDYIFDREG